MARIFLLCLLPIVAVTLSEQFEISRTSPALGRTKAKLGPKKLQGRYKSLPDQCRDRKPGYFITFCLPLQIDEVCAKLYCTSKRGDVPSAERAGRALNGSWCGDKKMCLKGKCVDDPDQPADVLKPFGGELCTDLPIRKNKKSPPKVTPLIKESPSEVMPLVKESPSEVMSLVKKSPSNVKSPVNESPLKVIPLKKKGLLFSSFVGN